MGVFNNAKVLGLQLKAITSALESSPSGSYANIWLTQNIKLIEHKLSSRDKVFSTESYDLESSFFNFYSTFRKYPFECIAWKFGKPIFSSRQREFYDLTPSEGRLNPVFRELYPSTKTNDTPPPFDPNGGFNGPSDGGDNSSTSLFNSRGINDGGTLRFGFDGLDCLALLAFGVVIVVLLVLLLYLILI